MFRLLTVENFYAKIHQKATDLHLPITQNCLYVSIAYQLLYHFQNGKLKKIYTISTSKNAPSCIEKSYGTPLGLHKIAEKIGRDQACNMVFESRTPTGKTYFEYEPETEINEIGELKGKITTRILWLKGCEPGINQGENRDTFARYIYIHGTNRDNEVGKKRFSQGCILMRNEELISFYDAIPLETLLLIET